MLHAREKLQSESPRALECCRRTVSVQQLRCHRKGGAPFQRLPELPAAFPKLSLTRFRLDGFGYQGFRVQGLGLRV